MLIQFFMVDITCYLLKLNQALTLFAQTFHFILVNYSYNFYDVFEQSFLYGKNIDASYSYHTIFYCVIKILINFGT